MNPTQADIERKLRQLAGFTDKSIELLRNLLDTARDHPAPLSAQMQKLAQKAGSYLNDRKLQIEINMLKLKLRLIEEEIRQKEKKGGT